ncbi:D-beta-hydroxybutyrate dehydrogenase, mitochondrial [Platysternon megacephalum]|uniref:D-beta-hydroxybutyrate dehydrogenase, mitochondrial n=1 Tax=Platysternon megacephalum TaxID=55544 RepID=A0A4D9E2A3_9SAUR|nr:D-beta-hydroxybutyrate dehydrogenase, mitochondrial [Platysternon megacephalum]
MSNKAGQKFSDRIELVNRQQTKTAAQTQTFTDSPRVTQAGSNFCLILVNFPPLTFEMYYCSLRIATWYRVTKYSAAKPGIHLFYWYVLESLLPASRSTATQACFSEWRVFSRSSKAPVGVKCLTTFEDPSLSFLNELIIQH